MTSWRLKLSGAAATMALLGLVVGTPAVLFNAGKAFWTRGSLPATWSPANVWSILIRPDDGTLLVLALVLVGWVSWAILSGLVAVEVVAAARGIRAPQLPGLPQATVRRLVTTAMLLFLAAPQLPTATALATPANTVAAVQPLTPEAAPTPEHKPVAATRLRADTVDHVVERGESLWSIAARHLGSGHRYTEIVDLNHDLLGGRANFVRPGWVLRLPAPATVAATASGSYTVTRGDTLTAIAEELLGDARAYPDIVRASRSIEQPGGRRLIDPDVIDVGWTLRIPGAEDGSGEVEAAEADTTVPPATPEPPQGESPAPTTDPPSSDVPATTAPAVETPVAPPGVQTPILQSTAPTADDQTTSDAASDETEAPVWLVAGLAGAGVGLAGSLWLALRRRREAQFRARRPGRMIASTPPELAPVEKTLATTGRGAAPTIEFLDTALRRLARTCARLGRPMPAVAAVQLGATHLVLHLPESRDATPPTPWEASEDGTIWRLHADTPPADLGELDADLPAPYPLLVTWGTADDGSRWLVNLEHVGVTHVGGPPDVTADFARYLVAEVAVNPWSRDSTVMCAGLGAGVQRLNPRRVTSFDPAHLPATAGDLLAATLVTHDRNRDCTSGALADLPTARAHQLGEELWDARLLVCAAAEGHSEELDELVGLVAAQRSLTGTAVLVLDGTAPEPAWRVHVGSDRRLRGVGPVPGLAAVGLSAKEAEGCAALLEHAGTADTEVPDVPQDALGIVNGAGQLHTELVVPRDTEPDEPYDSLLPAADEAYLTVAAATADDLAVLAPLVPHRVSEAFVDADPTLDDDLHAWHSDACPMPRLSVLGTVGVRVGPTGKRDAAQGRTPQLIDLVAFLTTRPRGATTSEVASAMGSPEPRVRKNLSLLRAWLGTNPGTGEPHVPDARHSRASSVRGEPAYEVRDVLVDADLFRRLRTRAQLRGPAGIADLERALDLVRGVPYEGLRTQGGAWLYEGDRLDHILQVAICDVAHTVVTARLLEGDTVAARVAAETALKAVPGDETAQLDLAAVLAAEGDRKATERHLRTNVCSRSDDEDPLPAELTARTRQLIEEHGWLEVERRSAV